MGGCSSYSNTLLQFNWFSLITNVQIKAIDCPTHPISLKQRQNCVTNAVFCDISSSSNTSLRTFQGAYLHFQFTKWVKHHLQTAGRKQAHMDITMALAEEASRQWNAHDTHPWLVSHSWVTPPPPPKSVLECEIPQEGGLCTFNSSPFCLSTPHWAQLVSQQVAEAW